MLCLFSSGSQAARDAAKRGRNGRGEAADVGGRIFSRAGADMGARCRARSMTAPAGSSTRPYSASGPPPPCARNLFSPDSQMAPHLLENTRNRVGNGRPEAEPDAGIAMRFLSWPPGLGVTVARKTRPKPLKTLNPRPTRSAVQPPVNPIPHGTGSKKPSRSSRKRQGTRPALQNERVPSRRKTSTAVSGIIDLVGIPAGIATRRDFMSSSP